jgi:hypothetical protein
MDSEARQVRSTCPSTCKGFSVIRQWSFVMDVDIASRIRRNNNGNLLMAAELAAQDYANERDFAAALRMNRNRIIEMLRSESTEDGRNLPRQSGGVLVYVMYWDGHFAEIKTRRFAYIDVVGRFADPDSGIYYFRSPQRPRQFYPPKRPEDMYPSEFFMWITQADVLKF